MSGATDYWATLRAAMPLLQQSTPSSARPRWQGTRATFVDLVRSVEGCVHGSGETIRTIEVKIGNHSGDVASADALQGAFTEAIWLSATRIEVSIYSASADGANLTVTLARPFPHSSALTVSYHSGTVSSRGLLRMLVENVLPESADPFRSARWIGPLVGLAWMGTIILVSSRLPRWGNWHTHPSTGVKVAAWVGIAAVSIAYGVWVTRLAIRYWFPALERLPDNGETRWGRARTWVAVGIGIWVTILIGVLALPAT